MYVLPDLLIKEIILAIETDTTMFPAGWVVRLFVNNITPDKNTLLATLTEVTNVEVPGYAPVAGAWQGTPIRKATGEWEDGGVGPLHFGATGAPPAPQIVYGWFATDAAKTVLLGSGLFLNPFTFSLSGDGFNLEQLIQANVIDGADYNLKLDMEQE